MSACRFTGGAMGGDAERVTCFDYIVWIGGKVAGAERSGEKGFLPQVKKQYRVI